MILGACQEENSKIKFQENYAEADDDQFWQCYDHLDGFRMVVTMRA